MIYQRITEIQDAEHKAATSNSTPTAYVRDSTPSPSSVDGATAATKLCQFKRVRLVTKQLRVAHRPLSLGFGAVYMSAETGNMHPQNPSLDSEQHPENPTHTTLKQGADGPVSGSTSTGIENSRDIQHIATTSITEYLSDEEDSDSDSSSTRGTHCYDPTDISAPTIGGRQYHDAGLHEPRFPIDEIHQDCEDLMHCLISQINDKTLRPVREPRQSP